MNKPDRKPVTLPHLLHFIGQRVLVFLIPMLIATDIYSNNRHIPLYLLGVLQGIALCVALFTIYGGLYERVTLYLDAKIYPDGDEDKPDVELKHKWDRFVRLWLKLPNIYLGLPYRLMLITISSVMALVVGFIFLLNLIDFQQFSQKDMGFTIFFISISLLINIYEVSGGVDRAQSRKDSKS
jgi:Na+/melibiose symporter-like transporter